MTKDAAAPPPRLPRDEPWALFLDIDGTLLAFMDDPGAVRADLALLDLLDRLLERSGGALALVSGRDIRNIDRITTPRRYPAAGSHGVELRLGADISLQENVNNVKLQSILNGLKLQISDGMMIEEKTCSIALHFRKNPSLRDKAFAIVQDVSGVSDGDFKIIPGKDVFEIAPVAADKGAAIMRFLALPPFSGRRPVFVGDDVTDEYGFAVVNAVGGVSIRVGSPDEPTSARYRLSTPDDLRLWLAAAFLT